MLTVLVALVSPLFAAEPLPLVREGQPAAVIVVPGNRDWKTQSHTIMVEDHSARCLQANFLQMSGALLPIFPDSKLGEAKVVDGRVVVDNAAAAAPGAFILLGDMPLTRALGVTADDLTMGGLRIKTFPNALVLLGHPAISHPHSDGGGLRAAVVELLEALGCRYLWPGETGKVVPQRRSIALAELDRTYNPTVLERNYRWFSLTPRAQEGWRQLDLDDGSAAETINQAMSTQAGRLVEAPRYQGSADFSWLQWQRNGGKLGILGGHAFGDAWAKWGAAHPEWFALQVDGTRDQSKVPNRARLCVSNLGLVQAVVDEIHAEMQAHPQRLSFSLSPNDGGYSSFCMCPACEALDAPDGPQITLLRFAKVGQGQREEITHVALTDRYVWFWNQIAQRVAPTYPNLLLLVDAYSVYSTAPRREKLHPNLLLRYVPSDADEWAGWKQAGAQRMYWRPNILLSGTKQGQLNIYAQQMAQTMHTLAQDGMLALDMDCITGSWATLGLNYYMAVRLGWNPQLTYDQVLDDFCTTGFGAAASPVRQYFVLAETSYRAAKAQQAELTVLPQLRALLTEADALAATNAAVQARINFLRLGLNFTELRLQLNQMAAKAEARESYDAQRANLLLDLNHLMMRELALHHPLAVDAGNVMRYSVNYRAWAALGAPGRRPNPRLQALAAAAPRMTGQENSLDQLLTAFGLDGTPLPADKAKAADPTATIMEADEAGVVRELPAP